MAQATRMWGSGSHFTKMVSYGRKSTPLKADFMTLTSLVLLVTLGLLCANRSIGLLSQDLRAATWRLFGLGLYPTNPVSSSWSRTQLFFIK